TIVGSARSTPCLTARAPSVRSLRPHFLSFGGFEEMLQNRRTARLRRIPTLELLEDRTVLSGNVLVARNIMSGQLIIAGDNGNNSYAINVTSLLGTPTLTVTGGLFPLASASAINGIPGGTFFTPLNGVN